MDLVCFATKGAGSNEEDRIQTLLSPLRPRLFQFDRARKRVSFVRLLDELRTTRPDIVVMEGTGTAGGVALLIEAVTDNRNRTGADVRHLLSKHGGSLGEPGSVSYLFDKQGVIVVDASRYDEEDLMPAIDAGAEDIALDEDVFEVITEPSDLTAAREALIDAGVEIESADLTQRPRARVPVGESDAAKLLKLIDALEESDDVGAVHANFDVDSAVLERVAQ